MASISKCDVHVQHCAVLRGYADRLSDQCRTVLKNSRFAKCKRSTWSLACRVVARAISVTGRSCVRLRLSYGATVYALDSRRERRLEARGFEPLTSSLQSWRSTN